MPLVETAPLNTATVSRPDALHSAFSALQADQAGWESLVGDLFADVEKLIAELHDVENQLAVERATLEQAQDELDRQATAAQCGEERSQTLQGQLQAAEVRGNQLEQELADERRRSAELESQLNAREQNLSHEREQMRIELQRVKILLQARNGSGGASPSGRPGTKSPSTSTAGAGRDGVLGSVMAQFQQLQRQAQQRTPPAP